MALLKSVSNRLDYDDNKSGSQRIKFTRYIFGFIYRIIGIVHQYRFDSFLEKKKPDLIVMWNDEKWHQSILKPYCEKYNIKTIYMENGVFPETVTMDRKGVNYNNSLPRGADFYRTFEANDIARSDIPLSETVIEESDRKKDRLRVYVPFQVDYDTQIISHSPWIKSMEDLFSVIYDISNRNSNLSFVVKEHPKSSRQYNTYHKISESISFCNDKASDALIEESDIVITVNSTVGLEALFSGKKVITLGKAFYNIDGLAINVSGSDELEKVILNKEIQPDSKLVSSFRRYLKAEYYLKGNWRNPDDEHAKKFYEKLNQLIKI